MTQHILPRGCELTAERAREVLDYDPETGLLTWKVSRPGCVAGAVAGTTNSDGYTQIELDRRFYKAHRVAWLIMTGEWPRHNLDHRNRIRNDNRWENLREATPLQNARNRSPGRTNKSGVVGVCFDRTRQKWAAYIGLGNKTLNLGCFEAIDGAVEARCEAERHYFGEFAAQVEEFGWETSAHQANRGGLGDALRLQKGTFAPSKVRDLLKGST